MTDIQSASSVSRIKSHILLGGSAQLRRQLPRPPAYFFNAIFGCCICWSINCPAFPGTKNGIFLSQKVISCELVKGVFPGSLLLCLTTVHNK